MMRSLIVAAACALAAGGSVHAQVSGPAACTGGSATLGGQTFACSGIDVLSIVPNQAMGTAASGSCTQPYPSLCSNDIWGWTDPTPDASGVRHEYAIVGLHNGTAFVDVTVPTAPVLLGRLPSAAANSSWRDVKVYRHYALVVSEANSHGMQVFDLERLRGLAPDAGRTFTADARYAGIGSAHNVVVNEATGFAYAVGARSTGAGLPPACNSRGFHAISLADPLAPAFAACFSDAAQDTSPVVSPGYTHDAQCVVYTGPDADYAGREICFGANEDAVTTFDVTDKANVVIVSQGLYPGHAYTHQGWLTPDQRYLIVNDEEDELFGFTATQRTMVFDMADLDNPDYLFAYDSGLTTIDHNLYVEGRYAYESNYEAGLRIVDVGNVAGGQMSEVAFFDTYPQATTAQFNGQWSNYPYFASGIVIASDARNGLFVLQPTALAVADVPSPAAGAFSLSAPAPNPTAGVATLALTVEAPEAVRAALLDATGREVAVVFDATVADAATLTLDLRDLAAGVYVVRVVGETFTATRRLSVAR